MMNRRPLKTDSGELTCSQVSEYLLPYLEQSLTGEGAAAIRNHLDGCASCRHQLHEELAFDNLLKERMRRSPGKPSNAATWRMRHQLDHRLQRQRARQRRIQHVHSIVALAIFLMAIALLVWWQQGEPPLSGQATATPPVVNPPTVPATAEPGSTPTPPGADGEAALSLRLLLAGQAPSAFEPLVADFEASHPGVRVEILTADQLAVEGEELSDEKWTRRVVSSSDLLMLGLENQAMEQGLLLDLVPYLTGDEQVKVDDFYEGVLDQYRRYGGIWALPYHVHPAVIYYDKSAFDEANLPYPVPGWNWEDFLTAARQLTEREGDDIRRWGFVELAFEPTEIIPARAGSLFDVSRYPARPRFSGPLVIDAVEWYAALYNRYEVAPYLPPPDRSGPYVSPGVELVEAGRAAMWSGSIPGYPWLEGEDNRVGVVPFPVGLENKATTPVFSWALAISAATPRPDLAWELLRFLSQTRITDPYAPFIQPAPARRSVADATGYWDELDTEVAETLRYALEHVFPLPLPYAEDAYREAVEAVVAGERSATEAMSAVQATAETAMVAGAEQSGAIPTRVAEAVTPAPGTTIVFSSLASDLGAIRELAGQFQREHPEIAVDVRQRAAGGDFLEAARSADCFEGYPDLEAQRNRESVRNLTPLLISDPTLETANFFPFTLDPFTVQEQVWALPGTIYVTVMGYNPALFEEAGVPLPTSSWTFDEFEAAAVALSVGEGEERQYGFVAGWNEYPDLFLILENAGAEPLDERAMGSQAQFDAPNVHAALASYAALTTEYGAKPLFDTDPTDPRGGELWESRKQLVESGWAAMWSRAYPESFLEPEVPGARYVPFPAQPDVGHHYQGVTGYYISAGSENPGACWQWLSFLTTQAQAAKDGVSARRATANGATFREQVGGELAEAYLATMVDSAGMSFYGHSRAQEHWLDLSFYWLALAYHHVVVEGADAAAALQAAQAKADSYRACLLPYLPGASVQQRVACLRQTDDTLPEMVYEVP